jgi:hypothetical protein
MTIKSHRSGAISIGEIIGCCTVVWAVCNVPLSRAQDVDWAQKNADACNSALGYVACANMGRPGGRQGPAVGYDPCYLAQNAMRPCTPVQRQPSKPVGVDPNIVGTWELPLKGGPWVWEILRDGTYRFHSEARDGVAPHAGTFSASNGHWSLKATNGYTDGGTYLFQPPDTWIATGQLGTAAWRHPSLKAASSK